jgi:hypothetical protein
MAQLASATTPSNDLAVLQERTANARPESEHGGAANAPSGAEGGLTEKSHVAVVVDDNMRCEACLKLLPQRYKRQVHKSTRQHDPCIRIDTSGNSDAR